MIASSQIQSSMSTDERVNLVVPHSSWYRPVDDAIIWVDSVNAAGIVSYTEIGTPKVSSSTLNVGVILAFWNLRLSAPIEILTDGQG